MYAKSFIALDSNGRLTGARTAQAAPYAHYTCHLCGSALRYPSQNLLLKMALTPICCSNGDNNGARESYYLLQRAPSYFL